MPLNVCEGERSIQVCTNRLFEINLQTYKRHSFSFYDNNFVLNLSTQAERVLLFIYKRIKGVDLRDKM